MNTEITEYCETLAAGWLFYDADCRFCVRWARRLEPSLEARGFRTAPLQGVWAREKLGLREGEPLTEMKLLTGDRVSGGADAVVEIGRRIWWAWPLVLASRLPGGMTFLRYAYRSIARRRACNGGSCAMPSQHFAFRSEALVGRKAVRDSLQESGGPTRRCSDVLDWLPLLLLPLVAWTARMTVPSWVFMWLMATAIFLGCKWITALREWRAGAGPPVSRLLAYVFAWPGMDAAEFLARRFHDPNEPPTPSRGRTPRSVLECDSPLSLSNGSGASSSQTQVERPLGVRKRSRWVGTALQNASRFFLAAAPRWEMSGLRDGLVNTCCGALLVWVAARSATHGTVLGPLATGWLGMIGLVMFLHFGVFHLLALMWRRAGVPVRPLMSTPLAAASLSDFWSRRWNTAFSALAQTLAFRPLANLLFRAFQSRQAALAGATLVVFFISGVVHELVISVPAGAGYGLPTAYFVLQAAGVLAERSRWGRCAGLGRGLRGWLWVAGFTAGPAYFLFHPPFVFNVILPMLRAIAAI